MYQQITETITNGKHTITMTDGSIIQQTVNFNNFLQEHLIFTVFCGLIIFFVLAYCIVECVKCYFCSKRDMRKSEAIELKTAIINLKKENKENKERINDLCKELHDFNKWRLSIEEGTLGL